MRHRNIGWGKLKVTSEEKKVKGPSSLPIVRVALRVVESSHIKVQPGIKERPEADNKFG